MKWTAYLLLCLLVVAAGPVDADESEGGLTVEIKIAGLALERAVDALQARLR